MRFFAPGAALLVGIGVGLLGGWYHWRQDLTYSESRARFISVLAAVAGPVDTVALGDSITEETWLEGACGRTFNAGIGNSNVARVSATADAILPMLKPRTIVLAVGANNFRPGGDASSFERDYAAFVDRLGNYRLILVGIPNSRAGSAFIEHLARRRGVTYLPPMTGRGVTVADGVHLTPAGAALFRQRIAQACRYDGPATTQSSATIPASSARAPQNFRSHFLDSRRK